MTGGLTRGAAQFPMHVVLRDGSTVTLRPARIDDWAAIEWLLQEMSPAAQALRLGDSLTVERLRHTAEQIVQADERFTLLATVGDPERVIAEGGFVRGDGHSASVSITVSEPQRGRGLSTHLLGALAGVARGQGITEFHTTADPDHHDMITVIAESGFPVDVSIKPGRLEMRFPTELSSNAARQFEARERIAAAQAARRFLEPRSVALIGASRDRHSISGGIFHNLLTTGFQGPVYPVNPATDVVQSVLAYPTLDAVPGDVELAIIAVPAAAVRSVIEDCASNSVPAVVIISAGFSESGPAGRELQEQVVHLSQTAGMRLIGPNCMGILNTDPDVGLNATFARDWPPVGNVGFASQSGALGIAIIEFAEAYGLGVSSFVSLGNKADISGNDLLCYWDEDERTEVILLYLESFGNPIKFSRLARSIGRRKPIVAVKSGRSSSGARAASSHTGALLGSSDATVEALFRQSGVIRTDTLAEMFDVASILSSQPLPRGSRVGIISNAGGPAILCADALEAAGVMVPELSNETQGELASFLPSQAGLSNPVDLIASATGNHYGRAIETLLAGDEIDALIVINIPIAEPVEVVSSAVRDATSKTKSGKPALLVAMTTRDGDARAREADDRLPIFTYPEAAARALARVMDYVEWKSQRAGLEPQFTDLREAEAAALVAGALEKGEEWLDPQTCWKLLQCYGLPVVAQRVVESEDQISAASQQLGSRVALKAVADDLLHKTEQGAVEVNLQSGEGVLSAARDMQRRLKTAGYEVNSWIAQAMADEGQEMLVGAVHDPVFGPVIACGAGGVMVEVMHDVSFRLAPLDDIDAAAMIDELKSKPLLTGFRGRPQRDVAALQDVLLRVSRLVDDIPQIAELDCNPVLVHSQGATIVDARIRLSSSTSGS